MVYSGENKQKQNTFSLPRGGDAIDLMVQGASVEPGVVFRSRLLEIRKGHLLLRQAQPPVQSSCVGMKLLVSYIDRQEDGSLRRIGFTGPLRSIVDLPSNRGQILLIAVPLVIELVSLRTLMRVKPKNEMKLSASLQMEGLSVPMDQVMDISIGGAKLSCKDGLPLSAGQRLVLSLSCSGEVLLLPAVILRQDGEGGEPPCTTVVRFVDLNKKLESDLKDLLSRLWKKQRQSALAEAAQVMLTAHPDSFFR